MYSCPTDDIHSVYIDDELPQNYVLDYENHIKTCSKCSAKLEQLKKIKSLIISDAKSIQVDDYYIEQSFSRLETKLRYSKNTVKKMPFPTEYVKWGAVAAIFVAVVLPFGNNFSKHKKSSNMAITPITRPQSVALSNNNVVINGNISDNLAKNVSTNAKNTRLADVEVFRPQFDENKVSVKIHVPGFNYENPQIMEVSLPANTFMGQLK